MHADSNSSGKLSLRRSLVSVAVATALFSTAAHAASPVMVRGVVAGALFTPPVNATNPASSTAGVTVPSVYAGAKVCFDLNNNGVCDAGEPSTTTSSTGSFVLTSPTPATVIAVIPTTATNGGQPVAQRNVFRTSAAQVAASRISPLAPAPITITPLTTELVRMMENDGLSYSDAVATLSERIGVESSSVTASPTTIADPAQLKAVEAESVVLTNRFGFAAKAVDRGDFPTIPAAQQGAMNLEGIPRYDHIFIVMLENKSTAAMLNSPYAPNINAYLAANNQFTNYYATGNPSEPNYTALGGADDFGITNDNQWNCNATGTNAPQDLPLPTSTVSGLASSPFTATCTDTAGVNHNIINRPNLFNALTTAGMTWRTYNESTNPGQDFRTDSVADPAIVAPDNVYPPGTLNGNTTVVGDPTGLIPLPAGTYKTKHNPAMAFQNVRSAVEFKSSNRTLGGGQWDNFMVNGSKYAIPAGFDKDQFGTDLLNGDVGQLNYVIPDQCDDMHSISVTGTDSVTRAGITASDCSGVAGGNNAAPNDSHDVILTRGDNYVKYLVTKIQSSPVWQNTSKREAIVLMFDEGSATSGFNSCCGWNPGNSTVSKPLIQNPDGTFSVDNSVANYTIGNRGHGNSIFAVITNQPSAPKGIKDSDAHSHFSFVRTLQDMFGVSDPKSDGSYMNRSKYTESFIAANILSLPEYAGSADTHFDGVRPMNHQFVIPANYVEKQSSDFTITAGSFPVGSGQTGNPAGAIPPQVGPDANQVNVWALK
ncbi:MAG: hypothetical protein JWL65_3008 [Gammaproteobacteria bacterium]|nr:hypothetical protein [Gammaproteobacteria bacterium]